jgi:phage gpG-like protein
MKEYSCDEFAKHLQAVSRDIRKSIRIGLEESARHVKKVAKKKFGHYQSDVGQWHMWWELAESTKADKERYGYVFNDEYNPLIRTGELKRSITYEIQGTTAYIGSTDEIMKYHEFGTSKMPPRAVLGPALFESKDFVLNKLATAVVMGIYARKCWI